MQFIFQHQPEQSENSQSGFFERLQSAQGAVGRSNDQQKQGQAFIDKARDLVDQQVDTYERSLKLIQETGLDKEQAQKVLDDPTNPYITDFMDFVERMDKNGTKFAGVLEDYTLVFNDQQGSYEGINYSSGAVERALKWGSVIYPNLKAVSQGFRYSLVKKAIADKTPAMDKFIGDLATGNIIGAGEREAVREELRRLNSGETILTNKNDETDEAMEYIDIDEAQVLTPKTFEEIKNEGLLKMDDLVGKHPELKKLASTSKWIIEELNNAIRVEKSEKTPLENVMKGVWAKRPDLGNAESVVGKLMEELPKEFKKTSDYKDFLNLSENLIRGTLESHGIPTTEPPPNNL